MLGATWSRSEREDRISIRDSPMTSLAIYRIDSISSVKLSILLVVGIACMLVSQLLLLNDASDISVAY